MNVFQLAMFVLKIVSILMDPLCVHVTWAMV